MRYFKKRQNKRTWKFTVTLITLAAIAVCGVAQASLVVIANPQLKIKKLTKDQLASLYLGKPVSLNANVTAYNQPDTSKVFQHFYQKILGWNASQVSSYWAQQIFSGFSQEPPEVSNDQAAIKIVENNASAIAYVNSKSLANVGSKVKVIFGNYKIPIHKKKTVSGQVSRLYSSSANNGYMTAISASPSDTDLASDGSPDTKGPVNDPDTALAKQLTSINHLPQSHSTQNIWRLIASRMQFQKEDNNSEVRHWIAWFQSHPKVLHTMVDNAVPYLYYVYHQTVRRHMPGEFALLPMIESGYNPRAYSSAGAAGLWQLMPGTASSFGMAIDWWYDSRRDILTSTNAGLNYLVHLHDLTKKWFLAAAAYNEGPGALESDIRHNKNLGKPTDFWDLRLPKQTEQYVPKLLAISAIIADPSKYGLKLPYVPNRPFFGSVTLTSQMDLQEMSQLSGVSIPVIKSLNPGLQRWATAPKGKFTLLLPVMSVDTFKTNLEKVIGKQHVAWKYHQVSSSETLASIASKNHTTVVMLEKVNGLQRNHVKTGMGILVPVQDGATYTKLAGITGAVKNMQHSQETILSTALTRAAKSQAKALPAEVTGEPIKASDNLKSLLGKLYGSD